MQGNETLNMIILGGVGLVLLLIIGAALRTKRGRTEDGEGGGEEGRLFESEGEIPRLPRNETLYQIIKTSTLTVNKINFDVNYIFDEVASLLAKDMQATKAELLFDIDKAVPEHLIASPKRLARVLINLLENALRYGGGIVVMQVSVVQNDGMDCRLRFTIRDKGQGMDADQMRVLFEDPERRAVEGKLPYGCYVANAIVAAEGGVLKIESTSGHGTSATFDMAFKVPQTHKSERGHKPSSEACSTARIVIAVRHEEAAKVLQKAIEPLAAQTTVLITEQPFMNTHPFENHDMVLIDSQLCNRSVAYGIKSQGARFVMICSIFAYEPEEWHSAADYLLSVPYTYSHLMEMMAIFYGLEGNTTAAPLTATFDSFVSNDQIPVTAGVSRKDFSRFLGAKLLIVEDNVINQRIIHGLLSDSGIKLFFADNGMDALETAVREAPLDLILMDLHIPEMDGLEAARVLRTDSRFKTTPIVAFTGLNQRDLIARMKAVGMTAHLSKPLNIGRLYTVFSHFVPQAGVAQSR